MTTFKPGETYKTRDGREARVYAVDGTSARPIHGAIYNGTHWSLNEWKADGRQRTAGENGRDLMPPKRELWVNFYTPARDDSPNYSFWPSREIADKWAGEFRIARIRVEYTEGQFDD